MSVTFHISYIISTYNRLPFLKLTLNRLIQNLIPQEEIVIIDANSTDGSQDYLRQLFEDGKIHQYISEPDKNQAHGWNKAFLLAKGSIIKKIIDDDVFDLQTIRKCADFMLKNPQVDVIISSDLSCKLSNYQSIEQHNRIKQYKEWTSGLKLSFTFGDVHMLIRRSSLTYIGLYNTDFIMMDWEYSLRISYLKAVIVYYTGYNALSVFHEDSVSAKKNETLINIQAKKACTLYNYAGDRAEISLWSKIKIGVGKFIFSTKKAPTSDVINLDQHGIYNYLYTYLENLNKNGKYIFLEPSNFNEAKNQN